MKIALDLLSGKSLIGNQVYTIELTRALVESYPEHEFRALVYLNKARQAETVIGNYPNLNFLNILPHDLLLGKALRPVINSATDTIKNLAASRVDLYHCTNPLLYPFGLKNGVVTLHDLIALRDEPWSSEKSQTFYRQRIGKVLDEAKSIMTVSEYTLKDLTEMFPACAKKAMVTPNAANPVFRPVVANRSFLSQYGISDSRKPFILLVGEIQPRKNIEGFLDAFSSLPESIQSEFQIVIVGSAKNPHNQERFERSLSSFKSKTKVYHLRNVPLDDLVKLYNTAFAFVYLSFFEGFGLPVIEAMSCSCPVLTSSTTSLGEVAADAGLTADPNDHEAVRHALSELLTNEPLREKLRQKGLERAQFYSWKNTAKLTMDGYVKALTR